MTVTLTAVLLLLGIALTGKHISLAILWRHLVVGGVLALVGAPLALAARATTQHLDRCEPQKAVAHKVGIISVGLGFLIGFAIVFYHLFHDG